MFFSLNNYMLCERQVMRAFCFILLSCNQSWIKAPRISDDNQKGVESFLHFAQENGAELRGNFFCPCVNCVNGRCESLEDIKLDLICDGFSSTYTN